MLLPAALVALTAHALAQLSAAPVPFEFKDGDRIVWIGNTLVEREQRYGYWETALLAANVDKKITVRNLGWSGDTVFGDARAGFDNAAKGFERLVSLTLELKPTVILVSYGTNESFEGKEGLPKFEKGLEKLLDALKSANARIVLFSPMPVCPFETPAGYPDPKTRNAILAEYGRVVQSVAERRDLRFADLYKSALSMYDFVQKLRALDQAGEKSKLDVMQFTTNGMHLTEAGYEFADYAFMGSLGYPSKRKPDPIPDSLRQAVIAKNELFFYRWRPQNETYLFGFRKHEQGKNAKEVAEFDPLVSKTEDEIEKLRKVLK